MRFLSTLAAGTLLAALSASSAMAADMPDGIATATTAIGEVLVDGAGMTLYGFDEDSPGSSACYGKCAENWPPLEAPAGAAPVGGFTAMSRDDGKMQWTYRGKPLYLWVRDKAPGDVTGDGLRGWHAVHP